MGINEFYGEDREWYLDADITGTYFYHIHETEKYLTKGFYFVTKDGRCRDCGEQAPKGLRFLVGTAQLKLAR